MKARQAGLVDGRDVRRGREAGLEVTAKALTLPERTCGSELAESRT